MGDKARAEADETFNTLLAAAGSDDAAAFETAQAEASEIVQSFRAAPLTEADKARRAGQLLRYLSLIPIEYGRGVKQGQVLLDLEIQEARAFLDGARAAFADLRLPLREIDAAETTAIERASSSSTRRWRRQPPARRWPSRRRSQAEADGAADRLQAIVPPAWLEAERRFRLRYRLLAARPDGGGGRGGAVSAGGVVAHRGLRHLRDRAGEAPARLHAK